MDGQHLRRAGGGLKGKRGVWSTNGEWIAFQRNLEIWLIQADGSQETLLVPAPDWGVSLEYAWSPGSDRLAFIRSSRQGYAEVWAVVGRAGREPWLIRSIDCCSQVFDLGWSPDGDHLLVYCDSQGKEVHLLMQADGQGDLVIAAGENWYHNHYSRQD
jgi:Tol biopolymer transport system component